MCLPLWGTGVWLRSSRLAERRREAEERERTRKEGKGEETRKEEKRLLSNFWLSIWFFFPPCRHVCATINQQNCSSYSTTNYIRQNINHLPPRHVPCITITQTWSISLKNTALNCHYYIIRTKTPWHPQVVSGQMLSKVKWTLKVSKMIFHSHGVLQILKWLHNI